MKNPYLAFVTEYARQVKAARSLPLGGFSCATQPAARSGDPTAMIFAPHPDDECIIGALPLRLLREASYKVVNVAVTQGSRRDRQSARFDELSQACAYLGFSVVQTAPCGLEGVNRKARNENTAAWKSSVRSIAQILSEHKPQVIFFPHEADYNSTHIGTNLLVMDALPELGSEFDCRIVETEFWQPMNSPNLMVESAINDVADLVAAISFHRGEVERNPYHIGLPAWMQDNVRRGAELVGGQGGEAPDMTFATLYKLRRWSQGQLVDFVKKGILLSSRDKAADLFK